MAHKERSRIDTHIHLFAEPHLNDLAWMTPDNILNGNHRIQEYASELDGNNVDGIVFVETDRKSNAFDAEKGWDHAVEEFEYVARVAAGKETPAEGPANGNGRPIKAIVPWAPIPAGRSAVKEYLDRLRSADPTGYALVKGVRYLVQDKPAGTLTDDKFVDAVNYLGEQGLVFGLGIDCRSAGLWQLEEAVEFAAKTKGTLSILNHLSKANLRLDPETVDTNQEFQQWKALMAELAKGNVVVKLSGAFSEVPENSTNDIAVEHTKPFLDVILDLWGVDRVIWGSDWPVCQFGGGPDGLKRWIDISERLLRKIGVSESDKDKIYFGNAVKAYNLS